jgi:hypothetical protein
MFHQLMDVQSWAFEKGVTQSPGFLGFQSDQKTYYKSWTQVDIRSTNYLVGGDWNHGI